ncbi:MAG: hypothetical protein ABIQ74_00850 [Chitinophagales bacterium]
MNIFEEWINQFSMFVLQKWKVQPIRYSAYGYVPSGHIWARVEDGIRYFEMMIGKAPKGSSPKTQKNLGLNKRCNMAY